MISHCIRFDVNSIDIKSACPHESNQGGKISKMESKKRIDDHSRQAKIMYEVSRDLILIKSGRTCLLLLLRYLCPHIFLICC